MQVKKAIFPVAGLGTRFLPATKAQPKEMLPVVDKPLIQYAVEEAYAAGVREMIFVTGRHKRPIEDHFDMTFELEVALEQSGKAELLDVVRSVKPDDMECIYVRQAQALGLGHAVLCGRRLVGHERASILAVQEVPAEHTRRYGIVDGNRVDDRLLDVQRIVEKPAPEVAPSRLGVAGRYILTPGVFHEIASQPRGVGGEIQLTDGIAGLLRREKGRRTDLHGADRCLQTLADACGRLRTLASAQRRLSTCTNSLPCSCCSTSSLPVWRANAWKSRTEPGSVASTRRSSPLAMSLSARLALRMGSGQFNPRVSSSLAAACMSAVR